MIRRQLNATLIFRIIMTGFAIACMVLITKATAQTDKESFKFDFGSGKVASGYRQVLPTTVYSKELGYGFLDPAAISSIDRGGDDALRCDFCTSDKPFFFTVDVSEGNYRVTITLGDQISESITTVKAESRRLMLKKVQTLPGEFETRTFIVNVRNSQIAGGGQVRLKDREIGVVHWDNQLTLQFSNKNPCVYAIEITKVDDAITVYLAGDSTVTDQTREPWASWGQMLPRFFKPDVAIANHAESGESLKSFIGERRLEKILSQIKAGDYLFIQFAHNDQKPGSAHVEPFTTYKEHLKLFINEARKHGATAVLVTSMHRRRFDAEGKIINTLGDYPEAMRQTATGENVALIDLNAMSKVFFEALGPEKSKKAFVHYPAGTFPGQNEELKDDSHFNEYGAYEIARYVAEAIKKSNLDLAKYVIDDLPAQNINPKTSRFDIKSIPGHAVRQ